MAHPDDNPSFDSFDTSDWDDAGIRDLIRSTPLAFDDDSQPSGYEAEELVDLDAIDLVGCFR